MNTSDKIRYFDYFISQIIGLNSSTEINQSQFESAVSKYKLSKLKLLKINSITAMANIEAIANNIVLPNVYS